MQRKTHTLWRVFSAASALGALWALAGCSAGPVDDYDRVRGIVIKGKGAEPMSYQPASDSLALTPASDSSTRQ